MSDPGKQERIEELLRKSLLGEELVDTRFCLFSARSSPSGQVTMPRILCANNILLAESSAYFSQSLSSDVSDPSFADLGGDDDIPNNALLDDYGYGSDSDLDECNDIPSVADAKAPEHRPEGLLTPLSLSSNTGDSHVKDQDELSEDGSGSDCSDIFVMSPEQPDYQDESSFLNTRGLESFASSQTAVQESQTGMTLENHATVCQQPTARRHILVKDTAFQTWYSLLNYLYTGEVAFLPLTCTMESKGQLPLPSMTAFDQPMCSAKSMYRLADKVRLDDLRDKAFAHIRDSLSEETILQVLSCSLVARYPPLLEMALDVLHSHIASPAVMTGFPALARRIANGELVHGAEILAGIHVRFVRGIGTVGSDSGMTADARGPWGNERNTATETLTTAAKAEENSDALSVKSSSFGFGGARSPTAKKVSISKAIGGMSSFFGGVSSSMNAEEPKEQLESSTSRDGGGFTFGNGANSAFGFGNAGDVSGNGTRIKPDALDTGGQLGSVFSSNGLDLLAPPGMNEVYATFALASGEDAIKTWGGIPPIDPVIAPEKATNSGPGAGPGAMEKSSSALESSTTGKLAAEAPRDKGVGEGSGFPSLATHKKGGNKKSSEIDGLAKKKKKKK